MTSAKKNSLKWLFLICLILSSCCIGVVVFALKKDFPISGMSGWLELLLVDVMLAGALTWVGEPDIREQSAKGGCKAHGTIRVITRK